MIVGSASANKPVNNLIQFLFACVCYSIYINTPKPLNRLYQKLFWRISNENIRMRGFVVTSKHPVVQFQQYLHLKYKLN